jgi:uncharacterized protein YqeY
MGIQERLLEDMKSAMKAGDRLRVDTIRVLRAMLKDAQIAKQGELEEAEVVQVLQSAVKKRREAIELYRRGGRQDLVEKEQKELEIIESYLPQMMSAEEIERHLDEVIARVGAVGLRDLGKVMAEAMQELRGKADGKLVQEIARRKLS